MRILICTGLFPPEIGGPATYSKLLFDELPKRGIEVKVLPFQEVRKWPYLIRHIVYFFKILKQGKGVDIIFAQDPVSVGLPACLTAKVLRKKFLIKIVGDYAWEQGCQRFGVKDMLDDFVNKKYCWKVEFLRKIQKFVANSADKIVTPSQYLKTVVSKWGINQDKIKVIYNAFKEPKSTVGSPTPNRESDFVLVSAGRSVPWKGFEMLKDLMPEIKKEILQAKLVILERESHEKVLEYLRAGDLFVLNTGYEGLSHQILEAMAMGIPVITTNVGGNPELIENNKNGILVEYNNKEQLKSAILKLYRDKELRERLIQNAKEKVKEFSKERMINKTVELLKS